MKNATAIILAAGDGTRMKIDYPKVLCKVGDREMIFLLTDSLHKAGIDDIVIVVGYKKEMVQERVGNIARFVVQDKLLGTGHAVMQAGSISDKLSDNIVVLAGDSPLISSDTIKKLVAEHERTIATLTLLTTMMENPCGYGRIIRNSQGEILKIVEEADANEEEKKVKEINTGLYCFRKEELFSSLKKLKPDNVQGEYYLTDVIGDFVTRGLRVTSVKTDNPGETMGINTQEDLKIAISLMEK